jgi:hypothetical protein
VGAIHQLTLSKGNSDHPPSWPPPAERFGDSLLDVEIEWLLLEDNSPDARRTPSTMLARRSRDDPCQSHRRRTWSAEETIAKRMHLLDSTELGRVLTNPALRAWLNVCFAPNATQLLQASELTRSAKIGLMHRTITASSFDKLERVVSPGTSRWSVLATVCLNPMRDPMGSES